MDKRQKTLLLLLLVALGYVTWQVCAVVFPAKPVVASVQQLPVPVVSHTTKAATPAAAHTSTVARSTTQTGPMLGRLTPHQQEYLRMTEQYQHLQMKKKVLQEQVAISASAEKIAEIDQKTQQIKRYSEVLPSQAMLRPLTADASEAHTVMPRSSEATLPTIHVVPVTIETEQAVTGVKKQQVAAAKPMHSLVPLAVKSARTDHGIQLTPAEQKSYTQLKHAIKQRAQHGEHRAYTQVEKALMKLPSHFYTLQLMGGRHPKELEDFIKDNHVAAGAKYFHTYYLNKDWYVLVYGQYKTYHDAVAAMETLPPVLQRLRPWVRPLSSVHQSIKLGNGESLS